MRLIAMTALALLAVGGAYFWASGSSALPSISWPGSNPSAVAADPDKSLDRFVEVAGARIRVRDEGPREAPTLLMLHGFTFSLESWDALADELSFDYRVVRYDLLGHGLTGPDPEERYAPKDRAMFAGQVADALGLEQPVLVGNSLGGLVSWRLAAQRPGYAKALVLISPGAFPFNGVTDEPAPVPAPVAFYLRNPGPPMVAASFAQIYADPKNITSERLETARLRMKGNGDAYIRSLELFTLPDPRTDLAGIEAPTLIIWGEADRVIPPAHGERIAAAMPDARLVTYGGVGHVAHEEDPKKVAEDIRAFLASIEGYKG